VNFEHLDVLGVSFPPVTTLPEQAFCDGVRDSFLAGLFEIDGHRAVESPREVATDNKTVIPTAIARLFGRFHSDADSLVVRPRDTSAFAAPCRIAWPFGQMQKFRSPAFTPAAEMAVFVVSMIPEFPQREHRWKVGCA
jgi:hypothetical protein